MPKHDPPYARALATLRALSAAPLDARFDGPLQLARHIHLAPTSGYRAVALAEAAGFLSRDGAGVYRRGLDACRVGLSALGFGDFAAAAEPVLVRLRQAARLTAFVGVIRDLELHVGPFSMGRGAGSIGPEPRVRLVAAPIWVGDAPVAVGLSPAAAAERRHTALLARLAEGKDGAVAVVGVLLPGGRREPDADLATQVIVARDRFLQTTVRRGEARD